MYFKTSHGDAAFREADFLMKKCKECMVDKTFFQRIPVKVAENSARLRKEDIMNKMAP